MNNNKIKNSACYKSRALQPFEAMSANKEDDGQEVYKKATQVQNIRFDARKSRFSCSKILGF